MGVKAKKDQGKKQEPVEINDEVSELEKQVFEIQLQDISRKINRHVARQEELRQKAIEFVEKAEECKRENGAIIAEHEQILAAKEEEKIQKREEALHLSKESKLRIEKHKQHIEELQKRYDDMVQEKTKVIEMLKEQARILEDFKQNKDSYMATLDVFEKRLADAEVEHQRILFNIERKSDIAKMRVKKEVETRLLTLSIEFQEFYQKRIGDSCHRMTLENKAIESELKLMEEELAEYRDRKIRSSNNVQVYKSLQDSIKMEKDKALARTILQKFVIQALLNDRTNVLHQLSEYSVLEVDHKALTKKLRSIEAEKHRQILRIRELNKLIDEKTEETESLKISAKALKKCARRLQVLIRNGSKIVEEAAAVRLIPAGGMEEERFLTSEAKIRLFKKRREAVFQKKGKILQYALEFFAKAQFTEEDLKLLRITSTDSLHLQDVDFSLIYGKVGADKELEHKESPTGSSLVFGYHLASDASLPRSASAIIQPVEEYEGEEEESFEGEMEGEYEEDEEGKTKESRPPSAYAENLEDDVGGEEEEDERDDEEFDEKGSRASGISANN